MKIIIQLKGTNMEMRSKVLAAAVCITVFGGVLGYLSCGRFFNWVYQIEPTNVWKPMDGPPGLVFYAGTLLLNIILPIVYVLLKKGIPGPNRVVKGLVFGLCVWAVGMLPGMFAVYTFTTIAPTVVIYWTIQGLVQAPLEGIIIAAICGK